MEENCTNKQSQVAFKDFKASVTVSEFESVLTLANEEYAKLKRVYDSKEKFERKTEESLKNMREQASNMPPGLLEKLLSGLERRANRDVFNEFEKEIKRHVPVTDFINRFRDSNNELEYLDFRTKKQKQKDGNI